MSYFASHIRPTSSKPSVARAGVRDVDHARVVRRHRLRDLAPFGPHLLELCRIAHVPHLHFELIERRRHAIEVDAALRVGGRETRRDLRELGGRAVALRRRQDEPEPQLVELAARFGIDVDVGEARRCIRKTHVRFDALGASLLQQTLGVVGDEVVIDPRHAPELLAARRDLSFRARHELARCVRRRRGLGVLRGRRVRGRYNPRGRNTPMTASGHDAADMNRMRDRRALLRFDLMRFLLSGCVVYCGSASATSSAPRSPATGITMNWRPSIA